MAGFMKKLRSASTVSRARTLPSALRAWSNNLLRPANALFSQAKG